MGRREDLERAREVLLLALDGDRLLQRNAKNGEPTAFTEPAAGLVRELRAVVKELDELDTGATEETSPADEIGAARAARRAATDDSASASRRSQPRRRGRSDRTG